MGDAEAEARDFRADIERLIGLRFPVMKELCATSEAIAALPSVMRDASQPLLIRQACLQSFLINVRALSLFLIGPGKGRQFEGDMFATEFVSDWMPDAVRAGRLLDVVTQVNKQLAHFTVTRMGDGWTQLPVDVLLSDEEIQDIADDVRALWDDFAGRAGLPRIGDLPLWHVRGTGRLMTEADPPN